MSVRKLRILIILLVVFGVLGAGGWFVVKKRLAAAKKATIVRVEEAQPTELLELVSAPAELEPKTHVEISAKVSGRVELLPFKVGDRVTKGDPNAKPSVPPSVIVRLDSKDLESQLLEAQARRAAQAATIESEKARIASQRASLLGTGATLEQAKTDLERQKKLLASKDISQSDLDQAQLKLDEFQSQYNAAKLSLDAADLNLKVLEHNLAAADAQISQAKETLGYTTITSPIDGVITRINAKVGEMVVTGMMNNPGTKILEVGDLSQMLAVAQVDEADVGKLEVGQKAKVLIDAYPNQEFKGTVYTIALLDGPVEAGDQVLQDRDSAGKRPAASFRPDGQRGYRDPQVHAACWRCRRRRVMTQGHRRPAARYPRQLALCGQVQDLRDGGLSLRGRQGGHHARQDRPRAT